MPRAKIADLQPAGNAAADTRTVQQQVTAATAVAEQVTAATGPNQKADNIARSDQSKTGLPGDTEKTAPTPNNTDLLVAVLVARPEIKSVSDLSKRAIAIDDRQFAFKGSVRAAIAGAGAAEVKLSSGRTKAINRLVSGEVPAAVLTLVSPEAAEGFPEIAGFKIFRLPLLPRSLKAPLDKP